jgi:hypothetical protein
VIRKLKTKQRPSSKQLTPWRWHHGMTYHVGWSEWISGS